jgi:hypothetical protein
MALKAETAAFGTTAPVWSVTEPTKVPSLVCAHAFPHTRNSKISAVVCAMCFAEFILPPWTFPYSTHRHAEIAVLDGARI